MTKTFVFKRNQTFSPLFKIVLLFFLTLVAFHSASARKIYSKSPGGNWTNTGAWTTGVVPAANDTVYIQGGHTVTASGNIGSDDYYFLVIIGTLDLTAADARFRFSAASKVIIENSGRILGNGANDQISIGSGGNEYTGTMGEITGPSYIADGHTPLDGEGTNGCGCYNSVNSCAITSSAGYTIYVSVTAKSIVKPAACVNGYNYNVKLDYLISISGNVAAANIYTLQGNITCGGTPIFFDLPNAAGAGTITTTSNPWRPNSDCATATVATLGCTSAVLDIEGNGITATTCSSSTVVTAPLPVKLISFTSKTTETGVELSWKTSMEENFDYFLLERAGTDLNFQPIATIQGRGGLDIFATYNHIDYAPIHGKNYYRLKNVDLDLDYDYSDLIYAEWDFESLKSDIVIYPNPITDNTFTLEVNCEITSNTRVSLLNSIGKGITQLTVLSNKEVITLPDNLKPGAYYLKIAGTNFSKTIKVFIQ